MITLHPSAYRSCEAVSSTTSDRDGAPWVAVVSSGLAKQLWPDGDPIGARVKVEPTKPWITIVGVVGDVRMGGAGAPQPSIYTSQRQDHWPGAGAVVVRAIGNPGELAAGIRDVVKRLDPTMPIVGLRTLGRPGSSPAVAERRVQMQMMLVFALVAIVVSAIGVYGVTAYATEARRREFGIRIALGASQRGVLWLALRDGANAAAIGALAGFPLALMLASQLRDMLLRRHALRPADCRRRARDDGARRVCSIAGAGETRDAHRSREHDANGLSGCCPGQAPKGSRVTSAAACERLQFTFCMGGVVPVPSAHVVPFHVR